MVIRENDLSNIISMRNENNNSLSQYNQISKNISWPIYLAMLLIYFIQHSVKIISTKSLIF